MEQRIIALVHKGKTVGNDGLERQAMTLVILTGRGGLFSALLHIVVDVLDMRHLNQARGVGEFRIVRQLAQPTIKGLEMDEN